ncbi:PDR/VanB family oxidoreductase [Microbacterium laevaniformans]|uniref:PDR/VanB family oxidoreductase n=1 Tax=Microbacterium laevaniformans TaxID=36807 RepID=UPI001955F6AD|nr:PDR/VanB family oxidoreductase [Microbacterium laevaniformans]MBM7751773.1 ferredoxin-NADP reductase [Microbacterium laevaniformans]GLJ63873.1 ferredoxin [Microbacterium laevaniformans]
MSRTISARVASKRRVADDVVELELVGEREPLPSWEPGAHADIHLPNGMIRQYSLLRGRTDPRAWRIAVLIEPEGRGGSQYLGERAAEDMVLSVGEPRNHFSFEDGTRFDFIGGGIGVTPLLSMMEHAEELGAEWELHYLGRSRSHLAYVDELIELYGDRVVLHLADEGGRIELESHVAALPPSTNVYSCGPERLLEGLESILGDSELLHIERFSPKPQAFLPNRAFTVVAARSGVEFDVPEDESILVAADFEGISVDGDCLEGTCGSCETVVIDGSVEHRDSILTSRQRKDGSCMMICVSRALGNRITLDL